jgi:hypothetical protein
VSAPSVLVPIWVLEDDPDWRSYPSPELRRRCRWTLPNRKACGKPGVADLKRGRTQRWPYCGDHLYGREWRDGLLWHTRWLPVSQAANLIPVALLELRLSDADRCRAYSIRGYVCTLPEGHSGQHEAWGVGKHRCYEAWTDLPATEATP